MSLSIVFRPQKDLYVDAAPDAYDEPYYNSRWVSGHLPVQYKIQNTKWPLNTEDDTDNVCAVTDVNGFAQINLCGTYETYQELEYLLIENSTIEEYNGVWQIIDKSNPTTLTINAAYSGNATAAAQRYYNNYHNLVKVYAGIPDYHQYASEDPMSLVATLKLEPSSNNISIADISGLVQAKLNCDNDLDQISGANDLNAWTSFYIEYAESYDVVTDGVIEQFTSSYITDELTESCGINVIENGDFTTNLNGWVNGSSTPDATEWVYDSGKASTTKGVYTVSKSLYQIQEFVQGVTYSFQASITNNEANSANLFIILYNDSSLPTGEAIIRSQDIPNGTSSISFTFTPGKEYGVIGFVVFLGGSSAQKISLDNVSATLTDCTYYGFAINGTRQFQNHIGGNFGDYVQNFNEHAYLNKFLTHFVEPIWFNDLHFDLSTIIPKSTFNATEDSELFYRVLEYTEGGGFISRQDISISDKNDGVYRLPISNLTLNSSTENFSVQIYQLPSNKLVDGNYGTFEYTTDSAGTPPSDWGITSGGIVSVSLQQGNIARSGTKSLLANSFGGFLLPIGTNTIWKTTSGIPVDANSDYIIEGYLRFAASTTAYEGMTFGMAADGIVSSYSEVVAYSDDVINTWIYFKAVFNTGANTSINVKAIATAPSNRSGSGNIYFDDVTVKGPIENLSEVKTIKVDNSCTKQSIYLTWLNNLGAWEYYNFKAEKDYGVDIGDTQTINRDLFNNWDAGFISGETEDDYIGIEAAETATVRSQFMTREELQAVKNIRTAIRVQQIRADGSKITVMVDKSSYKTYSDGDKLYQIEFDVKYPRIQIQRQ